MLSVCWLRGHLKLLLCLHLALAFNACVLGLAGGGAWQVAVLGRSLLDLDVHARSFDSAEVQAFPRYFWAAPMSWTDIASDINNVTNVGVRGRLVVATSANYLALSMVDGVGAEAVALASGCTGGACRLHVACCQALAVSGQGTMAPVNHIKLRAR